MAGAGRMTASASGELTKSTHSGPPLFKVGRRKAVSRGSGGAFDWAGLPACWSMNACAASVPDARQLILGSARCSATPRGSPSRSSGCAATSARRWAWPEQEWACWSWARSRRSNGRHCAFPSRWGTCGARGMGDQEAGTRSAAAALPPTAEVEMARERNAGAT